MGFVSQSSFSLLDFAAAMPTEAANSISPALLLSIYCALVMLASLAGGWLLLAVHLNHTRLQLAVSLVAGLMLGIALLHFLPDAQEKIQSIDRTMQWVLGGFLVMFFVQRFFHFHHHDLPEGDPEDCCHDTPEEKEHHHHDHDHDHVHEGHDHDHAHHEHAHTLAAKSAK